VKWALALGYALNFAAANSTRTARMRHKGVLISVLLSAEQRRSPKGKRLNIAFVFAVAFFFPHFLPKNRMSSPKTT
jgi:hypothetical protein